MILISPGIICVVDATVAHEIATTISAQNKEGILLHSKNADLGLFLVLYLGYSMSICLNIKKV
jgi:hypothetical protein